MKGGHSSVGRAQREGAGVAQLIELFMKGGHCSVDRVQHVGAGTAQLI